VDDPGSEKEQMKEGGIGRKWSEWSEVWIQGEGNDMKREVLPRLRAQLTHTRQRHAIGDDQQWGL